MIEKSLLIIRDAHIFIKNNKANDYCKDQKYNTMDI